MWCTYHLTLFIEDFELESKRREELKVNTMKNFKKEYDDFLTNRKGMKKVKPSSFSAHKTFSLANLYTNNFAKYLNEISK